VEIDRWGLGRENGGQVELAGSGWHGRVRVRGLSEVNARLGIGGLTRDGDAYV
jgi:hypothetical protein